MKQLLLFILVFLCLVGIAAADVREPHITLTNSDIQATSVVMEWKTNEPAVSTFEMNGNSVDFEESDKFEVELSSLKPDTVYDYKITACDASNNCYKYGGSFITKEKSFSSPFTGMAVLEMPEFEYAGLIFFGIMGVIVLVIAMNFIFQRADFSMPTGSKMGKMIKNAEKAIATGKQTDAYKIYDQIRPEYEKMNLKSKANHYDKIMGIHEKLKLYADAKEAHVLADKYIDGTINREETTRLRELLTN
ncbi:MAG: hypothetical protein GY861_09085 [bacterium]|nr:hypothetical protein [bacterium]